MKLIVGLGNPGKEYENTRHNAGFMALDRLAGEFDFPSFKFSEKHKAEISEGQIGGEKVLLAKPHTFMNHSGQAVRPLVQFHKIPHGDLVVLYDDIMIPQGTLRLRPEGSAGGHNGMKSIILELGAQDFPRVRLGIEPPADLKMPLADYVLGKFSKSELAAMHELIEKIPDLIQTLLKEGTEKTMAKFN